MIGRNVVGRFAKRPYRGVGVILPCGGRWCWSFEPFGDEPVAGVDVDLTEAALAGVHEFVRDAARNDYDLAAACLYGLVSGRKRGGAVLDHEDLLVGMPVESGSASGRHVYDYDRDGGVVFVSLNLVLVLTVSRVGQVDDARPARVARALSTIVWVHFALPFPLVPSTPLVFEELYKNGGEGFRLYDVRLAFQGAVSGIGKNIIDCPHRVTHPVGAVHSDRQ